MKKIIECNILYELESINPVIFRDKEVLNVTFKSQVAFLGYDTRILSRELIEAEIIDMDWNEKSEKLSEELLPVLEEELLKQINFDDITDYQELEETYCF